MTLAAVLGIIDLVAGLVMLWSALRITSAAGLRTTQGRWAMFRRFVYGSTSIAIFGLGLGRLDGDHPVSGAGEMIFQIMLLFGVMIFPLLRAANWITQDQFKAVDGTAHPPTGRSRS